MGHWVAVQADGKFYGTGSPNENPDLASHFGSRDQAIAYINEAKTKDGKLFGTNPDPIMTYEAAMALYNRERATREQKDKLAFACQKDPKAMELFDKITGLENALAQATEGRKAAELAFARARIALEDIKRKHKIG